MHEVWLEFREKKNVHFRTFFTVWLRSGRKFTRYCWYFPQVRKRGLNEKGKEKKGNFFLSLSPAPPDVIIFNRKHEKKN